MGDGPVTGPIVSIVPIVTGAASRSLDAYALASSPKKNSIYLYKKENAVTHTEALTIETIATIGRVGHIVRRDGAHG